MLLHRHQVPTRKRMRNSTKNAVINEEMTSSSPIFTRRRIFSPRHFFVLFLRCFATLWHDEWFWWSEQRRGGWKGRNGMKRKHEMLEFHIFRRIYLSSKSYSIKYVRNYYWKFDLHDSRMKKSRSTNVTQSSWRWNWLSTIFSPSNSFFISRLCPQYIFIPRFSDRNMRDRNEGETWNYSTSKKGVVQTKKPFLSFTVISLGPLGCTKGTISSFTQYMCTRYLQLPLISVLKGKNYCIGTDLNSSVKIFCGVDEKSWAFALY